MSALIVQGTSSGAGKSLLATVLCRHFARRGVRVAPFKAQNMSNNARVVEGGEIGTAQYMQARAAGVEPDVRMNPVLVKPEADNRSQVVVHGVTDPELSRTPWRRRAEALWPLVADSLRSLLDEYELLVLEGAGSPAEINLADCDMTNLRSAEAADAAALLVCDIDRGGAFAHLYGTWALMPPQQRARIGGFLLNKFRGDPELLDGAPDRLHELTGVPLVGVVPWLRHGLPDEDGVSQPPALAGPAKPRVGVVSYPAASNLDELRPLEQVAELRFCRRPSELGGADMLVLPGSKHVAADLRWLRASGFEEAIRARLADGTRLLGICGGMQMLGAGLRDPAGVDGDGEGLGLLPLETVFAPQKLVHRASVSFCDSLGEPWQALAGINFDGYEIRHGRTRPCGRAKEALAGGRGWVSGPVLGIAVHGLFEQPGAVAALLGEAPSRSLDDAIDELTDAVVPALDLERVERLAGVVT
ncbi:MAG TPA: cobyric acid synthase [Solirubrobacterales bacterium]|nr:cobyric acid synthase [Solirubrobacterales bacterium]